jgi:YbgC/YbaW family acyl-CoA thioester hydrolase
MPRIKIDLPASFSFSTPFTVRITDLNYGNHVGNDSVLSFLHEGRVRYLQSLGYSELNVEGVAIIMADAALVFKNEIYYGDELLISIRTVECSRVGFDLVYKIEKKSGDGLLTAAMAKTALVCYDYEKKKVVALPDAAKNKFLG